MAPEEAQGTAEATEELNDFLGPGSSGRTPEDTPDEGGESAPEQTEAQETEGEVEQQQAEGEGTEGETPEPFTFGGREFKSQAEAEESYKNMQALGTKADASQSELQRLQQFFDSHQGQQQPAAPPPKPEDVVKAGAKFLGMSPEQFIDHIDKGGYAALEEAVNASIRDSGVLTEARASAKQEAREDILEALAPMIDVVADINDDRQILALAKKHGDAFTALEPDVRKYLKAPGNQLSARQIYAELAIERLDALQAENATFKKGQKTKAGTAAAASAATRGSSKPGGAGGKPAAAKGGGDELDNFFGADGAKGEAIPGTGLVEE